MQVSNMLLFFIVFSPVHQNLLTNTIHQNSKKRINFFLIFREIFVLYLIKSTNLLVYSQCLR